MRDPLVIALDAIALKQAALQEDYTLLGAQPEAVTAYRRALLLEAYAALEEVSTTLRQLVPEVPIPPVVEIVPPSRRQPLPTPPPRRTVVRVEASRPWWATADPQTFTAEAERRRAS